MSWPDPPSPVLPRVMYAVDANGGLVPIPAAAFGALITPQVVTPADLNVQDTYTNELVCARGHPVDISISGTFVATLNLYRRYAADGAWILIGGGWSGIGCWKYTPETTGERLRVGIPSGGYTSGTVHVEVRQG